MTAVTTSLAQNKYDFNLSPYTVSNKQRLSVPCFSPELYVLHYVQEAEAHPAVVWVM